MAENRHRVLIVDDEPQVCALLTRLLPTEHYDTTTIQSGTAARQLLVQEEFDLIVSDIRLPDLDGVSLLRAVRERYLDVPVILITGAPDVRSAMQAVELGAMRYLEKPVDPAEFKSIVDRAVNLHELARLKRRSLALLGMHSTEATDLAGRHRQFQLALEALYMVYQPIVHKSGSVVGYEALVRSRNEALSDPHAIFYAAERLDKIWMLGRVIRQQVALVIPNLGDNEAVFVNLHPNDLQDEQLYSPKNPLARWASRVILEITERTRLDRVEDLEDRIRRLCSMGYRIAVDDLGAGYAGLSSLMQLNPHFVKFDMCLVRDIHRHQAKQKLVGSMIRVCTDLEMQVVCEGVEVNEERDSLVDLGADLMQGYLFGRPAAFSVAAAITGTADVEGPA